jgi:hypothetical protein
MTLSTLKTVILCAAIAVAVTVGVKARSNPDTAHAARLDKPLIEPVVMPLS